MVPGESHYVWGSRYRLRLVERAGRSHVEIDGDRLVLYVSEGTRSSGAASCSTAGTATQLREAVRECHRRVGAEDRRAGVPLDDPPHEDQVGLL